MTDYNKLTVANLRALLKERGIPSTGLTRKQQIIERLQEEDREKLASSETPDAPPAGEEVAESQQTLQDEAPAGESSKARTVYYTHSNVEQGASESKDKDTEQPGAVDTQATTQPADEAPAAPTADSSMTLPAEDASQHAAAPSTGPSVTATPVPTSESQPPTTAPAPEQAMPDAPPASSAPSTEPVQPEELVEDSKKRKRRSATPPVDESEVVNKKLRQDDDDGTVHLKEDSDMREIAEDKAEDDVERAEEEVKQADEPPTAEGDVMMAEEPATGEEAKQAEDAGTAEDEVMEDHKASQDTPGQDTKSEEKRDDVAQHEKRRLSKDEEKDRRFRKIFQTAPPAPTQEEPESAETDDRPVEPAVHPATSAVYIRNFMRPLQDKALQAHLITIATGPSSQPDESILQTFYLDQIKTHAFATFTSLSAAARVRSAMHNQKWPNERDRLELWADFVPEGKVAEWIEMERDGTKSGIKRWEVVYEDGRDGGVEALHRESVSAGTSGPSRQGRGTDRGEFNDMPERPDTISRRTTEAEISRPVGRPKPKEAGKGFVALDKLFKSTTAKPKLYFLPVADKIVDKRLDEFDRLTSRDWRGGRGIGPDEKLRKYTFEDEDVLVDNGAQFVPPGVRERDNRAVGGYGGPRGGFGGYGRRGGYGGFRGR
ncbi:hypothetical protein NA57DRAFT_54885 [Rhizodiscina lignyota]|uniref:SAP domain-containing protein n=1 Tax=Rhizodiscina lignyota TaxID=1504668 RepID=A0A9P4MAX7_9PEZI|nr:hypothetical protein NA57DRAFT_54885 [Rhizodiscina lignyota]